MVWKTKLAIVSVGKCITFTEPKGSGGNSLSCLHHNSVEQVKWVNNIGDISKLNSFKLCDLKREEIICPQ